MTLQEWNILFEILLKIVGTLAAPLAVIQLIEMRRQRASEISISLFEMYTSEEMVTARETLYLIEKDFNNVGEYLQQYHDIPTDSDKKAQDRAVLYRLRYFHQAGLLIRKGLGDADLLFGLIDIGLEGDYDVLEIIAGRSSKRFIAIPNRVIETAAHAYHGFGDSEAAALEDCLRKIRDVPVPVIVPIPTA